MPRKKWSDLNCEACGVQLPNLHRERKNNLCIHCYREMKRRRCSICGDPVSHGATVCRQCYEGRPKPASKTEVKQAVLSMLEHPSTRGEITELIGKMRLTNRSPHIRIAQFIRKDEYATLVNPSTNQKWYVLPKKGFKQWTLCSVMLSNDIARESLVGTLQRRTYEETESWPPGPFQWTEDWQRIWWAEPATIEDWPEDCYTEEGHSFYDHGKTSTEEE